MPNPSDLAAPQPEVPNPRLDRISQGSLTTYLTAIKNPADKTFPRLDCSTPDLARYDYLKGSRPEAGIMPDRANYKRYFFAIDLRQYIGLLPRLLGTVIETIQY